MKRYITIRDSFEGIHCWPDAPEEVYFLKSHHRHIFHVRIKLQVHHDDRELEFIMVKRFIKAHYPVLQMGSVSCEMVAERLIKVLIEKYGYREAEVEVTEDGENGGQVNYG